MIYVTGDMHGDASRFKSKAMRKLKKNDVLIVCGDFGFVWDGSHKEKRMLKWIGKRKYTVLFVEGVHDNLSLLQQYPEAEWSGGRVRELGGKLRQLLRGELFTIEGKSVFAFGGGEPDDNVQADWTSLCLPSPAELAGARDALKQADYKVDYIITHQPSRKIRHFLSMDRNDATTLDAFLDEVRESCKFTRWFFGSIHRNKRIPPSEMALFHAVVNAEGEE